MIGLAVRARDATARLLVGVSLLVLGYGTLEGAAPPWPARETYALLAAVTGVLWIATAVHDDDRIDRVGSAALMSLALMRGAGYLWEWLASPDTPNLAAVGAWGCVAGLLLIRPPSVLVETPRVVADNE